MCPTIYHISFTIYHTAYHVPHHTMMSHTAPYALYYVAQVVAAARQWFNCSSLEGAEMESQDIGGPTEGIGTTFTSRTRGCGLIPSHWEQRIFHTEVRGV